MMKKFIALFALLSSVSVYSVSYDDGIKAMKKHKYEKAIKKFNKAMEEDVIKEIVTSAQVNKQLKKAKALYLKEIVLKIKGFEREKKLKHALKKVEKGLKLLPGSSALMALKTKYEGKIQSLENKVADGKVLMKNKDWKRAYSFFKKLLPYYDTLSEIKSSYKKARSQIVKSYINKADILEKNYNFVQAKKEYERALTYDPKYKKLKKGIKRLKNRISAQKLFEEAKGLGDLGRREGAFKTVKLAYKKDSKNKEISLYMDMLKNEVAGMWTDQAEELSLRGRFKDSYLLINKAEKIGAKDSSVKKAVKTAKKTIVDSYALHLRERADGFKNDNEKAYIYYVASNSLNSKDKHVKDRIKDLEKILSDKICYKLGFKTLKSARVRISRESLSYINEMIRSKLEGFAKSKCIDISSSSGIHGKLTNTVMVYYINRRGEKVTAKLTAETRVVDGGKTIATVKRRVLVGEADRGEKTSDKKVLEKLVKKIAEEINSGLKRSNLKYHGDRYYTFFNGSKDRNSKTRNAVLTYMAKKYLSEKTLYVDNVVSYVLQNYGVDLKRKKIKVSKKTIL